VSTHLAARSGLGIDPASIAATLALGKSLSGILSSHPKDAERFKRNGVAYQQAVQGQQNALEYLKYRSGRYGIAQSIGYPYNTEGPVGGWATQSAKDDAFKLYQAALAAWGVGVDEMPDGAGGGGGGGGVNTDPFAGGGGGTGLPPVITTAQQSYMPILIGLGLLGALYASKRGRR
jgi:hypothetical protein